MLEILWKDVSGKIKKIKLGIFVEMVTLKYLINERFFDFVYQVAIVVILRGDRYMRNALSPIMQTFNSF